MGHVIVVDLGYGDAGKGTVVDWLCARAAAEPVRTVVRFNGGAQAGHNVVTPDGRHHTFAQFGSGSFTRGVRTHLSRFSLVDPLALVAEADHLAAVGVPDALARLTVDKDALLTTPYHRVANRARELARGAGRHGSCGMGVGETASYALAAPDLAPRVGDCGRPAVLARKLAALRDRLADELGPLDAPPVPDVCAAYRAFARLVRLTGPGHLELLLRAGPAVFEGAQGVLLDQWHGFHPYTTWSTTTFANAETLLAEAGMAGTRLGVVRCYLARHGPGPLVTEDPTLELPEPHNPGNQWQGPFRVGHFDAVALRYAVQAAGGVDALALTHLDAAERQPLRLCRGYLVDGRRVDSLPLRPEPDLARSQRLTGVLARARPVYAEPGGPWPDVVAEELGAPVVLTSSGPTRLDKAAWDSRRLAPSARPAAAHRFRAGDQPLGAGERLAQVRRARQLARSTRAQPAKRRVLRFSPGQPGVAGGEHEPQVGVPVRGLGGGRLDGDDGDMAQLGVRPRCQVGQSGFLAGLPECDGQGVRLAGVGVPADLEPRLLPPVPSQ